MLIHQILSQIHDFSTLFLHKTNFLAIFKLINCKVKVGSAATAFCVLIFAIFSPFFAFFVH